MGGEFYAAAYVFFDEKISYIMVDVQKVFCGRGVEILNNICKNKKERLKRRSIKSLLRAPHLGMVSQTLPLQLTQPRHPHGTQEILLSAATFLS